MFLNKRELVCTRCGIIGEPNQIGLGLFSGLVAIFGAIATMVVLVLSVIPGLIIGGLTTTYILYYQNTKGVECRHCLAQNTMVPVDTPHGARDHETIRAGDRRVSTVH